MQEADRQNFGWGLYVCLDQVRQPSIKFSVKRQLRNFPYYYFPMGRGLSVEPRGPDWESLL